MDTHPIGRVHYSQLHTHCEYKYRGNILWYSTSGKYQSELQLTGRVHLSEDYYTDLHFFIILSLSESLMSFLDYWQKYKEVNHLC